MACLDIASREAWTWPGWTSGRHSLPGQVTHSFLVAMRDAVSCGILPLQAAIACLDLASPVLC
jgi:hypothetical protein